MTEFAAHPLTHDRWGDLVTVFGGGAGKGECGTCWCMWWRLPRSGGLGGPPKDATKAAFQARVASGPPPGLVGYADATPVGWIQVGPRLDVPEWNKPGRLTAPPDPSEAEDPHCWGLSCFVIRTGLRRQGHAARLLDAAIDWARTNGARTLDACPVETHGARKTSSALYHGPASLFVPHGFTERARRRADRPLLRLDLS